MFDRFDTGKNCAPHTLGAGRVRRHGNSRALRHLNRELQFVECKCRMRTAVRSPTIISVNFYPISALANLFADNASQTVDTISFFSALRYGPFGRVTLRPVTAGCDDRPCGDIQPWARNYPLLHRLL